MNDSRIVRRGTRHHGTAARGGCASFPDLDGTDEDREAARFVCACVGCRCTTRVTFDGERCSMCREAHE